MAHLFVSQCCALLTEFSFARATRIFLRFANTEKSVDTDIPTVSQNFARVH